MLVDKKKTERVARFCSEYSRGLTLVGAFLGIAVSVGWFFASEALKQHYKPSDDLFSQAHIKLFAACLIVGLFITLCLKALICDESCDILWTFVCFFGVMWCLAVLLITKPPSDDDLRSQYKSCVYKPIQNNSTLNENGGDCTSLWKDLTSDRKCCGFLNDKKEFETFPNATINNDPCCPPDAQKPCEKKDCTKVISSQWMWYASLLGLISFVCLYLEIVHLVVMSKNRFYSQANADCET